LVPGYDIGGLAAHNDGVAALVLKDDPDRDEIALAADEPTYAVHLIRIRGTEPVFDARLTGPGGLDGERDTEDDVPFENAAAALDLLGIDMNGRPDLARRFTINDATTRIESIGQAEGAKRKITAIVRNRTGKPALLERTEEIIPLANPPNTCFSFPANPDGKSGPARRMARFPFTAPVAPPMPAS